MRAERRTPPTTTISAILQTISWHSTGLSFLPNAFLTVLVVNLKRSINGSGPEARPPKVFNGAPASLILLVSHFGICPPYSNEISSLNALAQPNLESATTIVVSVSYSSSGTDGILLQYYSSTENPTPVPFIST